MNRRSPKGFANALCHLPYLEWLIVGDVKDTAMYEFRGDREKLPYLVYDVAHISISLVQSLSSGMYV